MLVSKEAAAKARPIIVTAECHDAWLLIFLWLFLPLRRYSPRFSLRPAFCHSASTFAALRFRLPMLGPLIVLYARREFTIRINLWRGLGCGSRRGWLLC